MPAIITIRRTAAVGAAISGLLHLLMMGHGSHLGGVLLMGAMAIVCLPCAGHLWRTSGRRSWILIGVMNAAMLAVHLWMLSSGRSQASAAPEALVAQGHLHGAAALADAGTPSTGPLVEALHQVLLPAASAVALAEVLLAAAGLLMLRRAAALTGR